MDDLLRLKLDRDVNVKEFLSFLDFHQFQYKKEEEDILNLETMLNEKSTIVLIDENKMEEFKVLVLVYKDLLANKSQRHLNIPIENSLIDYEKTRKINTIELVDENGPFGDELFSKANKGEAPTEKDMEDSFYGYKKKKKEARKDEPLSSILNKKDFEDEIKMVENQDNDEEEGKSVILEIIKIIGLLIFTCALVLIFVLIR